jgi:hypothetical protein
MSDGSGEIIIKGGSVSIEFDEGIYTGTDGKYNNPSRKIRSIEITDDNTGQVQKISVPTNGKCIIRIRG